MTNQTDDRQEFLTKFTRKESFWFGEDEHKFDSFIDNGTTTVDKVYAWHQAKMKEQEDKFFKFMAISEKAKEVWRKKINNLQEKK